MCSYLLHFVIYCIFKLGGYSFSRVLDGGSTFLPLVPFCDTGVQGGAVVVTGGAMGLRGGSGVTVGWSVTSEGMEIHFTPDPAKTLRVNNIHATLCGCLFTHRRNNRLIFHVRSASSRHFMPKTRRCVLRSFG